MNPFELAMKMEQDGELFYKQMAEAATNAGFREIFTQLAEDEQKHYHIFKNLQLEHGPFQETVVLKFAGNLFKKMIVDDSLQELDTSQLELYQQAMDLEKMSRNFYLEQAEAASDERQKELLQKIAAEEEKHYLLLHNIYELVLRPQTWVENGEFVHLEDY